LIGYIKANRQEKPRCVECRKDLNQESFHQLELYCKKYLKYGSLNEALDDQTANNNIDWKFN